MKEYSHEARNLPYERIGLCLNKLAFNYAHSPFQTVGVYALKKPVLLIPVSK